ncbi:MAG: HD domain-containing protein [Candidatus Babeliales bacterium]|jgi:tRNA nucleotidyltransferase (CCA-adding enzyme)
MKRVDKSQKKIFSAKTQDITCNVKTLQITSFLEICKSLCPIVSEIKNAGGIAYMVGGSVRDLILNYPIKDVDIEVHGVTTEGLEAVLSKFGKVVTIGKQFGVLKLLSNHDELDIDWSLPRTDSKGRKPTVKIDPDMDIKTACRRRDLTMNAMAIDLNFICQNFDNLKKLAKDKNFDPVKNLQVIDPYGGLEDIKNKRLRAVDEKLFLDDPLRFFRVMQFIGRFEMQPDAGLNKICNTMSLSQHKLFEIEKNTPLAKERIHEELKKLFLKSKLPSLGFRWLLKIGRLKEIFPELSILVNVRQNPKYHPEGDVFEHTMQVLDAAAIIEFYDEQNKDFEQYLIMLAALCHDLGKASKTDKDLHCKGHEFESVKIAARFLKRLTSNKLLIKTVKKLVKFHCMPLQLIGQKSTLKAYKKLAIKLAPETNLRQLALLWLADNRGRNKNFMEPHKFFGDEFLKFIKKAEQANVVTQPEAPILLGRHLIDIVKPGPEMGKLLKKAYRIQIEHGITELAELKKRVLKS